MTVPVLTLVEFTDRPAPSSQAPLVVLGPSLGTSAASLWSGVARRLAGDLRVVGWDLPGHGGSAPTDDPFTIAELARGVLAAVDGHLQSLGEPVERPFCYAGNSIGGCVGQQLLLDAPERVHAAVLLGTAARVGEPAAWAERAQLVAAAGTPTQVTGSAQRWFAPGFIEQDAVTTTGLLHDLQDADRFSYARACEALGAFDLRGRLGGVRTPVLTVAGAHDVATPPEAVADVAEATGGRAVVLAGAAHLIPAEAPQDVARLLAEHFSPHLCRGTEGARA
ncbi:alpha/beta hydrolase [Kocuria sp.]|uniref:alpha/beta fold hydrolase n=1 Tax=Kocuria sp. TaxID=1871328 RepID=UPI002810A8D0|nr:alpha/beta hydrolase [Kocuria sp.]